MKFTTPQNITSLKENEIFVFGSNLNGNHAGGAALLAQEKFGAQDGVCEGLTGQSYAFPTLDKEMKKVTKEALLESKEKLYKVASENPDKIFLVTKLGCGIAGFIEEDVKQVFQGTVPSNVMLPTGWVVIRGFKAFDKGLLCRGFQYELGKDFTHDGGIALCQQGYHFCQYLPDVYQYYNPGSVVAEVEAFGDVVNDENKSVTNGLRVIRILCAETEARANTGKENSGFLNTGDLNTGDLNTGNWNTGNRNTGNRNTGNRNTGDLNTGNRNTGDLNTGNWNTGNRNTGFFNTETPDDILVFGKKCKRNVWEKADKPSFLYFALFVWIEFSDMTDDEKNNYPEAKTTGGYLKKKDYKEAFQESYAKASEEDKKLLKKLPNFNAKVFYEISGIKICHENI